MLYVIRLGMHIGRDDYWIASYPARTVTDPTTARKWTMPADAWLWIEENRSKYNDIAMTVETLDSALAWVATQQEAVPEPSSPEPPSPDPLGLSPDSIEDILTFYGFDPEFPDLNIEVSLSLVAQPAIGPALGGPIVDRGIELADEELVTRITV